MKKIFLFILLLFVPILSQGYDVLIDGIYYNLITKAKEAEVTYGDWEVNVSEGLYSGAIEIPETITYNGVVYNVTSIGKCAFSLCRNLTSAKLPKSIRKIDDSAFNQASKLSSISIPDGVETIGMTAFQFTGLKSIIIPNSVVSIGYMAFVNCEELESLILSNSLKTLDVAAFMNCSKLESISFPESLTNTGKSAFWGCTNLKNVVLSSSIKTISETSFKNCTSLSSIIIPNTVSTIGVEAFVGCTSLKDITIGWGVESISKSAFSGCKNLNDVYCYTNGVPSTSGNAFDDSFIDYSTLHVRESAISQFKDSNPWSDFKEIVKLDIPKHSLKYIVDGELYKSYELEEGALISPEPAPAKEGFSFSGWDYVPQRMLYDDITINGSFSQVNKCAAPNISYNNGTLSITCDTEDVEFVTEIKDDDIKQYNSSKITLTATYNINVYAKKPGFENSDVVKATLCWVEAEPKTEGISNGVANIRAQAVLIHNNGGMITVNGIEDGTRVSAYSLNGIQEASTISTNGTAVLNTSAKSGSTIVVRFGERAVKVILQ